MVSEVQKNCLQYGDAESREIRSYRATKFYPEEKLQTDTEEKTDRQNHKFE